MSMLYPRRCLWCKSRKIASGRRFYTYLSKRHSHRTTMLSYALAKRSQHANATFRDIVVPNTAFTRGDLYRTGCLKNNGFLASESVGRRSCSRPLHSASWLLTRVRRVWYLSWLSAHRPCRVQVAGIESLIA